MSAIPPPPPPPKRRYSRTFFWGMILLGLAAVVGVLLLLMPLNGAVVATILLLVGVLVLVALHYAMWAWLEESPSNDPVVVPPDPQGRRGPPHRNGSPRPGDPSYTK